MLKISFAIAAQQMRTCRKASLAAMCLQVLALQAFGERQGGRTKPILDPSGGDF